jgi:hypothetical protein
MNENPSAKAVRRSEALTIDAILWRIIVPRPSGLHMLPHFLSGVPSQYASV